MLEPNRIPGSFRDRSGYVFEDENVIYRAINLTYKENYDLLLGSGLLSKLMDKKLLLPFKAQEKKILGVWKIIKPEKIKLISYPYEWSFEQLKDAALVTLNIQLEALKHGMTLKDASAYNIQYYKGKLVHIDHLSFEKFIEGQPWVAYRQFVMNFLGPLILMAKVDSRHALQLRNFIDGLPLDYISRALPLVTWLNPSCFLHIHLHAILQKKYSSTDDLKVSNEKNKRKLKSISYNSNFNLINSLMVSIKKLTYPGISSEWGSYYNDTNYSAKAFKSKKYILKNIIRNLAPESICDLGSNDGEFSQLIMKHTRHVISVDSDHNAVNNNYINQKKYKESVVQPLMIDICNPSPSVGWSNIERDSFLDRGRCDLVMGLALIHHLCISNNIPLSYVAKLFYSLAPVAVLEFTPKEDSQVQRLLSYRDDIFDDYSMESCIAEFLKF